MPPVAVLGLAACSLLPLGALGLRRWLRQARYRTVLRRVTRAETLRHARLLLVKQKQLVIHDGYGNVRLDDWIRHANYFIDNVILREARRGGVPIELAGPGTRLRDAVTRQFLAILKAEGDGAGLAPASPDATRIGQDYEARCHAILSADGWTVSTTPLTGDQGADLVANADGHRLVLQCKCHAKPVGNKAVQEAVAALALHGGDRAAVVSASGFTRSAEDLARVNGVLLLHHDQLIGLRQELGTVAPPGTDGPLRPSHQAPARRAPHSHR